MPHGLCYFFSPCSRGAYTPVWVINSLYGLFQLFENIFERVPASEGYHTNAGGEHFSRARR